MKMYLHFDIFKFTKEILNGKLYFCCGAYSILFIQCNNIIKNAQTFLHYTAMPRRTWKSVHVTYFY